MFAALPLLDPFSVFRRYKDMRSLGLLGMNQRNHKYIARYNARSLFPIVDNKLHTKELALEYRLTTPDLLGVIDNQHDASLLDRFICDKEGFCIKPAKGSGGKGILVIKACEQGRYQKTNGDWLELAAVQRHVSNILAGLFSLGGATDVAMIETLLVPSHALAKYSHHGVPDIRVIVFRGIPVMAMMRLACTESHGKANLHQGAIGVGLNIATGRAINAVQRDRCIERHPDTGVLLSELQVPRWHELLRLACSCHEICGLGYLGVDLVIDEREGPALLELNARPGLSIQIANNAGLLPRLRQIEAIKKPELWTVDKKIEFALAHFSR